jgi:hypothetical protein
MWFDISLLAQFSEWDFAVANQIGNTKASHEVKS